MQGKEAGPVVRIRSEGREWEPEWWEWQQVKAMSEPGPTGHCLRQVGREVTCLLCLESEGTGGL